MMNDITYGATLVACLIATVTTVWMAANAAPTEPHARAVATTVGAKPAAERSTKDPDKGCTTLAAAPTATE